MGCDIHMFAEKKTKDGWVSLKKVPYDGRNYEFFALLADVRNKDGIIPISQPRGIPKDVSEQVKKEYQSWDSDAHSASYFTLHELKTIPPEILEQEYYDSRLITSKDEQGNITSVCRGTIGKHFGIVGKIKLFALFGNSIETPLEVLIKNLESIKKGISDREVRVVFWFDN